MQELTPTQKLDMVLNVFATNPKAFGHISDADILKILNQENINIGNDLISILNKLERDIYVETHINSEGIKRYVISFEGKVFNHQGGYDMAYKFLDAEKNLQSYYREHSEYNATRLNRLTFWLAVGTISLSLVEVLKLLNVYLHFF